MTDYAMFATARVFATIQDHELTAKVGSALAEVLRRMSPGDHVVPLFQSTPAHWTDDLRTLGDDLLSKYGEVAGSVPYLVRIIGAASDRNDEQGAAVVVPVELEQLPATVSAKDFLRLRELSDTVASQFQSAAPPRPIQEVASALVATVRQAADSERDEAALFRRFSLVAAQNVETATHLLSAVDRAPREGDMAFLFTRATMPGLVTADATGSLPQPRLPISHKPEEIKNLLIDAQRKATPKDPFNPEPAIAAADELIGLLGADESVKSLDDFAAFYAFRQLSRAVTQALDLVKRPLPPLAAPTADAPEEPPDHDTAAALQGLSVEAVLAELPEGFTLERSVVAAAVASLRAGKHLLLGGPPGSGKTTLAEALCRAVVSKNYDVTTATADWTTFDTIGGYLPDESGLRFVPGVVLRSLRTNGWLVIDEVNRADIDKAFGPLFTVLSGGEGSAGRTSTLPYTTSDGKPVTIEWATSVGSDGTYTITPSWRLIGTLNVSDKASLFRLSFAFLRRFAVIDVPLPPESVYRLLFARWFEAIGREETDTFVNAAMAVASGPVPIGPAIGRDFARLVVEGLTQTASGEPTFASDSEAILTAIRLLVVPQYEGQPLTSGEKLLRIIDDTIRTTGLAARTNLEHALREVALS